MPKNYQRHLFFKYVVCHQERNGMRHEGKSCPNRNIYSSEVWILLETFSQKLGYIPIKTCHFCIYIYIYIYIYIPWIVTFLVFINTKIKNKHQLLFVANLLLLFYEPISFWAENVPKFLENKQNFNPHLIGTEGEIQLWLTKITCLTYFLLQVKAKNYWWDMLYTNKVIINLKQRKCKVCSGH